MPLRSLALALLGGALIASALLSCARSRTPETQPAPSGTSDLEILPPPPQEPAPEGSRPQRGRIVIPPVPKKLAPPRYPDAAVSDGIACVAQLLYHIETDGTAKLVRLEWEDPPPPEHLTEFEETIRAAVSEWAYIPAIRLVPTKMPDGSTVTERRPVPKARHAVVRFRVVNGEGVAE